MFMSRPSIGNRLLRGSIGLSPVFATLIASQPQQLAAATIAPSSLVSACSGVSLPASAVTNIVAPVITGVAAPLQSSVNGLLSVLAPKVNIDTTSLLNSAASGQPITLQALATDGTVIGSNSSCYSQATGYTLSGTSGISIGGNQITGLGSGAIASAGEINSIAFGNNAVTAPTTVGAGAIAIGTNANVGAAGAGAVALGNNASVLGANGVSMGNGANVGALGAAALALGNTASVLGANGVALGNGANVGLLGTNGVAIGNGASATTANSVAIGSNSVASRIVLPGSPAEVSIGAAGAERQLTNLAAGTATTDAVNLGQLNVVSANVATNTQNIATLTTNVGTNTANIGVLQGGLATATANVGQLQTGLATANANVGLLQSGLSSANANIGQLQTSVTANTAGLSLANTNLAGLTGTVNGAVSSIGQLQTGLATVNGTIGGLQTSVNANTTGLATAVNNIATNTANLGTLTADVGTNTANIGTLTTNVAANTASLGTLTTNVAANTAGLDTLANAAVQYDNAGHTTLSLGGNGSPPVLLANVKAGTLASDSTQAVNGSQLLDTNNAVALNGTQIATANANISTLGTALGQVTTTTNTNTTNIANLTTTVNDNSNLLTVQGDAIGLNANAIIKLRDDTANGAVGPVQYSNPATPTTPNGGTKTNDLTLVGRDPLPVQLHNVGDGVVAAGSKDGVNGGQLFALQNSIGSLSDLAVQYDDPTRASVTFANAQGGPVALRNIQAGTLSATSNDAVNGSQLFTTNQNVSNIQTNVTNQGNQLTTLSTQISSGAIGPVQYSTSSSPTTPSGLGASQDLTLVGLGSAPVGLHNVAQGTLSATSTDAVNGAQLFATNSQISSLAGLSVQYDDSQHNHVTFGGPQSGPVTLSNVASGNVAANSTEAVNGGQLFALSNQIDASSALAVQYDDAARNRITLASSGGAPVALSGVAAGDLSANSTDAVNGGQLYDTNQTVAGIQTQVTNQTNQYQTLNNQYLTLNTQIATGSVGPVRYSSAADPTTPNGSYVSQDLTLVGANGGVVGLHNVADGTLSDGSTDAVNGEQLFATNQAVTSISTDLGNQANQLTTLNTQVINNSTALGDTNIALNQLNVQVSDGAIGPVQYSTDSDPTTPNGGTRSQDLTLVGADSGAVSLHNVAAGSLSMTSLDAVNGSQMFGFGSAVANVFGGNYAYNPLSNSFSGSFSYGGNSYASIQSVLGAIQSNVATSGGSDDGSIPAATKYFHTTSTMTDSTALGSDSTAIGPTANSSGDASIAVGRGSAAMGGSSVAIGDGATAQDGKAVSIGVGNIASGNGAVSIGDPNTASGEGASALGKDNTATGDGAIAMGNTSSAVGTGAVALGNTNSATGDGAVSLGNANSASGLGSIAIGSNNSVTGAGSLAIGSGITNSADDTLSIGNTTLASATSAVAFGNRAQATGVRALAVGTDTTATGEEASSYGSHSDATGNFATALGADAQANGLNSASLGFDAQAVADLSTSIGAASRATGYLGTAIGQMAVASGLASTAIGTGATASNDSSVAIGTGSIADQDSSVALGAATETVRGASSNYSAFGLSALQSSQGEIAIGRNLQYTDLSGNLTPTGDRQITGVAAGSAGTDAVNVSQLRGVSSTLGNAFATGLGGGATYNSSTGQLAGPSYTLGGVTYTNVGDALQALATTGTGTGTGTTTPTSANSVNYASTDHSTVTLASTGTVVQNVAAGEVSSTSTDAVNGSQLNATNQQVSQLSTQVSNGAVGVVRYANAATPTQANGGTQSNDATLVGANAAAPVGLHNVASGSVAEASTDAVNGGQLYATNQAVSRAQSTADTAMTMSQNSVQYDSSTANSVTLGNSSTGAVALHNVAAGQSQTDAVNVGQMNAAVSSAVSQSNAYTDGRITALAFDLRKVNRNANAGTAGAMALAGMPQPYEAGKGMVSMGMATYQGQTAVAFGVSKAFDDGHTVMKVGATYNSSGAVGASVGAGYQF